MQPSWATLRHSELLLAPKPAWSEYGWWLFLVALSALWSAIMVATLAWDGIDGTWCCMSTFIPFLWGISALIAHELVTRRELRWNGRTLQLITRFGPFRRSHRVPIEQATVVPYQNEGSKGSLHIGLHIEAPWNEGEPTTHSFRLPGARNFREHAQAIAELEWVVDQFAKMTPPTHSEPHSHERAEMAELLQGLDTHR